MLELGLEERGVEPVDQQIAGVVARERQIDSRLDLPHRSHGDLGEQRLGRQSVEALGRFGPHLETEVTGVLEGLISLAQGLLLRDRGAASLAERPRSDPIRAAGASGGSRLLEPPR